MRALSFLLAVSSLVALALARPQSAEARVDEVDDPQIRLAIAQDGFGSGE